MAVAPRLMLPSFCSVKARPADRPAWISAWSSTRRSRCGRAAAGGVPSACGGAEAMLGDRRELVPAALTHEVALTLGEHDQVGPGLGLGAHAFETPESAISAQASRSSVSSSETSSILAGFCSIDASIRCLRQKA